MSVSDGTRCLLCTDVFAMRIRHLPTNQDCRFFRQEIGWFFPSTSVAAGDIRQDIEGLILMHSSTFSLIPESSNGTMWRIKEFGLWRPVRVFPWNLDFGFLKQLHEMRWKWCGNSFFWLKRQRTWNRWRKNLLANAPSNNRWIFGWNLYHYRANRWNRNSPKCTLILITISYCHFRWVNEWI